MDTLIVYCHPYEGSFCHAVRKAIERRLAREDREFEVADLYADKFEPAMSAEELAHYNQGTIFDPLVAHYISLLEGTRHLVLIFPIWWNDAPAMLRGWLDRVLLIGHTWDVDESGMVGKLGHIEDVTCYTSSDNPTSFLCEKTGNGIRHTFLDGTFMQLGIKRRIWHNFGMASTASNHERIAWLSDIESGRI